MGTPPDNIRQQLGDLPRWFCTALGVSSEQVRIVRVFEGERLPEPDVQCVAIITGSWDMVTDRLPWSEYTAQWIHDAMDVEMPLFGVCYGHQLIAHALGGCVDYHPGGREMGCEVVELLEEGIKDSLVGRMPARFVAHLTHRQTVLELPPGAVALARSSHDPHQIIRYGRNAISTQFHPEFTPKHLQVCLSARADVLLAEGFDTQAKLDGLVEAPFPKVLMQQFVQDVLAEGNLLKMRASAPGCEDSQMEQVRPRS